jgi:hypothetical protein
MQTFGSDKGQNRHNYTAVYSTLFSPLRHEKVNLFEMGIGTNNPSINSNMGIAGKPGASINAWSEYFTKGLVFSADIDRNILFQNERIKTFYCDQTSPEIITEMWDENLLNSVKFDIIIDDGLHTFEAGSTFLSHSIHKLKKTGFYVIEDVDKKSFEQWQNFLESRNSIASAIKYAILQIPHPWTSNGNNLIVIKRGD